MSDESIPDHPKDDRCGGAAFPMVSHGAWNAHQYADAGMSLRDWFAGKALVGMIGTAATPALLGFDGAEAKIARAAYAMSDAMLAERRNR